MHDHMHDHSHTHVHEHHEAVTPREELLALLKYMTGHNAAHIREMTDLAERIRTEEPAVFEKLTAAAARFEEGNAVLQEALDGLGQAGGDEMEK